MQKIFYNNDVYELTHRYECEGHDTLMIMYRQPNGWGGYEIKVSESQCSDVGDRTLNKREMLVRIGWQNDDDVLEDQCRRDYDIIATEYKCSMKLGKIKG